MKNRSISTKKTEKESRFHSLVRRLDEKDKALNPMLRKSKWILSLVSLFLVFGISFVWFPEAKLSGDIVESPEQNRKGTGEKESMTSTFEMPVDSFELHLKRSLNENILKKE